MIDATLSFLKGIPAGVRSADLIDILLAAGFIYGAIHWLRQSTSPRLAYRMVLFGFILAATYAMARRFEMVLLEMLVLVSLLLAGLGTAVFYQRNIQRTFDRLLLVRFRRPMQRARPLSPVAILCEAVGALVAGGRGALIAIRGRDTWIRQVEGGVRLEGILSVPLLLSLFDPGSAGHDGAVLIEDEVITYFGAHLPLSTTGPSTGTRHAAGLGLSEQCDAFVIIVSEERGSVSVARDGKLEEVAAAMLERSLASFWADRYGSLKAPSSHWMRLRNLTTPLLSVILAILLWLLFAYRPEGAIQTFMVPIEYVDVPPHLELVNPIPISAQVTLSGSEQTIQVSEPPPLIISIDLSEIVVGTNRLAISESDIRVPKGWTLYQVEPSPIIIAARHKPPPDIPEDIPEDILQDTPEGGHAP